MSDTALHTPSSLGSPTDGTARRSGSRGGRPVLARVAWWLAALAVLVVAAAALRWADTRPGYDPYGWLGWGYQTLHGTLDLGGAPSWKPFSYIFNVVYALFGHWALYLWMETAVAISLAGAVFGGRIAYRLTATEDPRNRWAPIVAAIVGGAGVLAIGQYFHYVMSAQSDSMAVTTFLAAIDFGLRGRVRWAWWMAVLTGLARPEIWPFAGLFAVWCFIKRPAVRWHLYAGVLVTAFLWFGIPYITNGRPDVAGQLALRSPRELHQNKITGTLDRVLDEQYWPLWVGALIAVGLAALRRSVGVLALGALVVGWMVVELAFVLHGFPGVPRYVFEPAGLTGVLAGIAVGWLLLDASRLWSRLPSWAGVLPAVALVAVMVPKGISQLRAEHKDIAHERGRTTEINKLGATITALGGPRRVLSCGHPVLNIEYVSVFAWYTHLDTGHIGYRPMIEVAKPRPDVLFTSLPNGWAVTTHHQHGNASCASLRSLYVPTARHPQGVLVPGK